MILKEIESPHPLECVRCLKAKTIWDEKLSLTLPDVSFGLRTQTDIRIIKKILGEKVNVPIITPYASRIQRIRGALLNILNDEGIGKKPLVIPDVEPEAFSFNCVARHEYRKLGPPSVVSLLLDTSLSGSSGTRYTSAWRSVQSNLQSLYIFTAEAQRRVGSQIYFAPTPLIRGESVTVKLAIDIAKELLLQGLKFDPRSPAFPEWGISFLIHSDFFGNDVKNEEARQIFLDSLQNVLRLDDLPEHISISIKLSDDKLYSSTETSAASRRINFSHLVGEMSFILEDIRNARGNGIGGSLIFQNAHPGLLIGFFDSGVNVCAPRISGDPTIDVPRRGKRGKQGKRAVTAIWDHEKLSDQPLDNIKKEYEQNKAFTVPKGIDPIDFWDMPSRQQYDYYYEMRVKSCMEIVDELKNAIIKPDTPYRDELRDRANNAAESQILFDLCPTLNK